MLEAVKMRLTSKAKNGTVFTFEGKNIPDYLVIFLKSAFPNVEEVKSEDNEESIRMEARSTPAESLKLLRTTFGYTQQQLADKAGITKQQVSAMERGKEPIGRKMAHRLADALGTSYRNLFW